MQPRYMENVLRLPVSSIRTLERVFQLPRKGSLFFRLRDAGVDHAKAVLALLYSEDVTGAEVLLGHSITVCPPCLRRMYERTIYIKSIDEARVITVIARNPRLPTTPSFFRYASLKSGMTVAAALSRGVSRRDIREWAKEGSIQITDSRGLLEAAS